MLHSQLLKWWNSQFMNVSRRWFQGFPTSAPPSLPFFMVNPGGTVQDSQLKWWNFLFVRVLGHELDFSLKPPPPFKTTFIVILVGEVQDSQLKVWSSQYIRIFCRWFQILSQIFHSCSLPLLEKQWIQDSQLKLWIHLGQYFRTEIFI